MATFCTHVSLFLPTSAFCFLTLPLFNFPWLFFLLFSCFASSSVLASGFRAAAFCSYRLAFLALFISHQLSVPFSSYFSFCDSFSTLCRLFRTYYSNVSLFIDLMEWNSRQNVKKRAEFVNILVKRQTTYIDICLFDLIKLVIYSHSHRSIS